MDSLTDLVFRYCVIFGKRFFPKEKISFLRAIAKELIPLGYQVDAKHARQQLTKRQHQNYYNAYIGDINSADLIICTNYDTGVNYHHLAKTFAFNQQFNKQQYFLGLLPLFVLLTLSIILNYFIFLPGIQENGFMSFSGVASVITTVVFFYFILRYRNGMPNKKNFICNSSSILLILNLMSKLDKKERKKIAFVLTDGGCNTQFGLKMFEQYSPNVKQKKVIFLDSIGNGEQLQILKPSSFTQNLDGYNYHSGQIDTIFKQYLLISSGEIVDDKIEIKHAYSSKDNQLSIERLENHTKQIHDLCQHLLTSNKSI